MRRVLLLVPVLTALAACSSSPAPQHGTAQASQPCPVRATRIPDHGCGPGRSYSQADLERTGATTAGGALRLLDPAVTVH
jgi:hypothetical protein